MSKSYTQEQLKDLWEFFDEDQSNSIPCSELENVYKKLGHDDALAKKKAEVLIFIFRQIS